MGRTVYLQAPEVLTSHNSREEKGEMPGFHLLDLLIILITLGIIIGVPVAIILFVVTRIRKK